MSDYPLTTNHFQVEWGGANMGFTEVSGLSIEYDVIEHREGSSPYPNPHLMPGLIQPQRIILKRGLMKGDNAFYEWINTISLNTVTRRDLTISLLDESHNPVVVWKVQNAWPVKIDWPVLKAGGNEVAIESIEIAHEGIIVQHN